MVVVGLFPLEVGEESFKWIPYNEDSSIIRITLGPDTYIMCFDGHNTAVCSCRPTKCPLDVCWLRLPIASEHS